MRKNRFLKTALIAALVVCGLCLVAKSFLAIHTYPEYKGDGVMLMIKLDPLGPDFVQEDTFRADQKSPLRICWDEMIFVGQNLLEGIFKVPLPVWLFVFLLLLAVLLKMQRPGLKKRWLAAGVFLPPLFVGVLWLLGTHNSPVGKTYSIDGQYSFYCKIYNYNRLCRKTDYKLIVVDEVEHRVLHAEKVMMRDIFGYNLHFSNDGRRVCWGLDTLKYYDLPRPIDEQAVRQARLRNREREDAIRDSIWRAEMRQREIADSIARERKWAEARQLFRQWQAESPIPAEDVARLKPVIRPWLDFYDIDLSQARLNEKTTGKCFNCPPDTTSIHYDPFTDDLDTGERIDVDYSPDRQRYVDLGLFGGYYEQDGEYVFVGWDDMHEIHLVDRRQRHQNMILWFGVEGFAEAAFWKSDDVFVVVGYDYDFKRFVRVFDIAGRTETYYTIFADTEFGYDQLAYLHNVYWPQKGITIHVQEY